MQPTYLLDTNICIYVRRKKPPQVLARFARLEVGEAALSVITYGELLFGAYKSAQREFSLALLQELFTLLPPLPLPLTAAESYGALRSDLEGKGAVIGNNDLWIAAHAIAANLTLVTNNEKEFRRISGLKIENWAK